MQRAENMEKAKVPYDEQIRSIHNLIRLRTTKPLFFALQKATFGEVAFCNVIMRNKLFEDDLFCLTLLSQYHCTEQGYLPHPPDQIQL